MIPERVLDFDSIIMSWSLFHINVGSEYLKFCFGSRSRILFIHLFGGNVNPKQRSVGKF